MRLSEHFTLEELVFSQTAARTGLDNTPDEAAVANLKRLCVLLLEPIRCVVFAPIQVTSGYRSPAVNALIGSKRTSQHTIGCAADIKVQGRSPDDVVQAVIAAKLPYDQLICEFNAWTHVSVTSIANEKPRRQVLIIDKNGTRPYM